MRLIVVATLLTALALIGGCASSGGLQSSTPSTSTTQGSTAATETAGVPTAAQLYAQDGSHGSEHPYAVLLARLNKQCQGGATIAVTVQKAAKTSSHTRLAIMRRVVRYIHQRTDVDCRTIISEIRTGTLPTPTSTPPKPTPTPTPTSTSVAPPPPSTTAAPPAPTTAPNAPTGCYPKTNSGNCYEPGEYCRNSDHGQSGVAGDGEAITCQDNNGWRWEPS